MITGYTDSTLPYYWKLCEETDLPCYGTLEQFEFACDKEKFKSKCRDFGISVVDEYKVSDAAGFARDFEHFPVLIKPVDNSGARGIQIVPSAMEFEAAYENALKASPSQTVLVERLMNAEENTIFYLIVDGEVHLLGTADRYVKKIQPDTIPLPIGYTFPSQYHSSYCADTNEKVISMLKSLKLQNGLVFIQSFVDKGEFVFYEMGFRLTGSLEHHIYEAATGFNPVKMLINFAVTGEMIGSTLEKHKGNGRFQGIGANVTLLLRTGEISQIVGVDKLDEIESVLSSLVTYKEGDVLNQDAIGTLQQVGMRVLLHSYNEEMLRMDIDRVLNQVDFLDEFGRSMIMNKLLDYVE